MNLRKQAGFAAFEVLLVVGVVVIIGLVALKVMSVKSKPTASQSTTQTAAPQDEKVLTSAQETIDNENLDTQTPDEASLDAEMAAF